MTTLQKQARALGDPTRYRIFRFIADAAEPMGVAALTDHVGLSHNAVRQYLAELRRPIASRHRGAGPRSAPDGRVRAA
jgi:hypothetical protein